MVHTEHSSSKERPSQGHHGIQQPASPGPTSRQANTVRHLARDSGWSMLVSSTPTKRGQWRGCAHPGSNTILSFQTRVRPCMFQEDCFTNPTSPQSMSVTTGGYCDMVMSMREATPTTWPYLVVYMIVYASSHLIRERTSFRQQSPAMAAENEFKSCVRERRRKLSVLEFTDPIPKHKASVPLVWRFPHYCHSHFCDFLKDVGTKWLNVAPADSTGFGRRALERHARCMLACRFLHVTVCILGRSIPQPCKM